MIEVCNSCGGAKEVQVCQYCPTLICVNCRSNHENVCQFNSQIISRGSGPTVRNSVKPRVIEMPAILGYPYDFTNDQLKASKTQLICALQTEQDAGGSAGNQEGTNSNQSDQGVGGYVNSVLIADVAPEEKKDIQ